MMILAEGSLGNHHRIAETTEMGAIAHFLCKDIAGIYDTRDMSNVNDVIVMAFPDLVFSKIQVFYAFVCNGGRPANTGLVVVINGGTFRGVRKTKIVSAIFQ